MKPEGCTTVEEWLAAGGTITRDRDDAETLIEQTIDGVTYEFEVAEDNTARHSLDVNARYRCRLTGVLGYRRVQGSKVVPYVCRHVGCTEFGVVRGYGNATWCETHRPASRFA